MNKKDIIFILLVFVIWRIIAILFAVISPVFFPLQTDFLGGGIQDYLHAPFFWGWLNFDGEHYLSLVRGGYLPLTYFYFPLYPILIKIIAYPFKSGYLTDALVGLLISNTLFFIGILGLWKLLRLDYQNKIAKYAVILLIIFPTSFYLGSYYTESLFLALAVWSFIYMRKKMWIVAGILVGLSCATRIVGVALIPALLYEIIINYRKKISLSALLGLMISPAGLIVYMFYLNRVTGDPLAFFHNLSIFGAQRQSSIVLLPQVLYRYIFKILPAINYSYFPVVFSTYLEFLVGLIFILLVIFAFLKLRLSYAIYMLFSYLIPTFSGSFSSFSRYALIIFPGYILMAEYLLKIPKHFRYAIIASTLIILGIATMLFIRGYWIA